MKVSRDQMAQNRNGILEAASRLFRQKGFDAVGIAEVMKAAGMTHGGFYGHFRSKDDLIAQTMTHVLGAESAGDHGLDAFLETYLSRKHRDNPAGGCPIASLAADIRHQTSEAKAAMTQGLRSQIDRMSASFSDLDEPARRQAAIACWSAMVGALILARATDDAELADEIICGTRSFLGSQQA